MTGLLGFIGLDGLPWHVIYHYYRRNRSWYNLVEIAREGVAGFNWCIPPYTPPSWVSIFTGVKASKHGILGFSTFYRRGHSIGRRLTTSLDLEYPMLNEILSLNGLHGVAYNVYPSYPLEGLYHRKQIIISDLLAPSFYIHPSSYEHYRRYFNKPLPPPSPYNKGWVRELLQWSNSVIEGLKLIIGEYYPDYLVAVFREPDYIMHYLQYVALGVYDEYVAEVFSLLDEFIGWIRRRFKYVFIASDHGFAQHIERINLYHFLRNLGGVEPPLIGKTASILLTLPPVGIAMRTALSNLNTQRLYYLLRNVLRKPRKPLYDRRNTSSFYSLDDVDSDDAWCIHVVNEQLYISILEEILNKNNKYVDIVDTIDYDRRGIRSYIVKPRIGYYSNDPMLSYKPKIYFNTARHSNPGIFIANRPSTNTIIQLNNYDILPTILSIIGYPIPSYTDGEPLGSSGGKQERENYLALYRIARKLQKI